MATGKRSIKKARQLCRAFPMVTLCVLQAQKWSAHFFGMLKVCLGIGWHIYADLGDKGIL